MAKRLDFYVRLFISYWGVGLSALHAIIYIQTKWKTRQDIVTILATIATMTNINNDGNDDE